jgi:hypothetical protein
MLGKRHAHPSHPRPGQVDTDRRQFLRRAGVTAVVTTALAGVMDMAGMSALASTRLKHEHQAKPGTKPDACCGIFTYSPRHCNGGNSCPSGQCCFYVQTSCGASYYACITHSCSSFSTCP